MKKIFFLLFSVSCSLAMEDYKSQFPGSPPEASYDQEMLRLRQEELKLEKEHAELRKKKLDLYKRNTQLKEMDFLIRHLSRITFELPDRGHTVEAFIHTAMKDIYTKVQNEMTPDQRKEMQERIVASKEAQEKFEKGALEEVSDK